MRFKIDWASLIVESKFIVFALFYFTFQVQAPGGAYIWRGDLTEGFLRYRFGGLTFGGPYFRNFTVRSGTSLLYEKCIINLDFHVRHFGARDPYIR